jgi:ribosomal-protein-alanine N-acetyltransferase
VVAIEEMVHPLPWQPDTFLACFRPGFKGWVAVLGYKIIGFIVINFNSHDLEYHILNLGVLPAHRRAGWGRSLMKTAFADAASLQASMIYLEVRRSNLGAIALYKKMGFQLIGLRKNYYPEVAYAAREDALVFARILLNSQTSVLEKGCC